MAVEKNFAGLFEKWVDCPECNGEGKQTVSDGVGGTIKINCGNCENRGRVPQSTVR